MLCYFEYKHLDALGLTYTYMEVRVRVYIKHDTEIYFKKPGFRSNKSRHCAYIMYSVNTRFFKRDMLDY